MTRPLHLLGMNAAFAALMIFAVAEAADAQRGGRGGGGGGRQVRASSSGSISGASRASNRGNVNRGGNVNRSGINNSGNRINTGDVNINRDIDVDVDNGWGGHYHPVARGAAIAATTAVVMGAYYSSLPTGCATVIRGGVSYYSCGSYWYQPVYQGSTVQYVVVPAP